MSCSGEEPRRVERDRKSINERGGSEKKGAGERGGGAEVEEGRRSGLSVGAPERLPFCNSPSRKARIGMAARLATSFSSTSGAKVARWDGSQSSMPSSEPARDASLKNEYMDCCLFPLGILELSDPVADLVDVEVRRMLPPSVCGTTSSWTFLGRLLDRSSLKTLWG